MSAPLTEYERVNFILPRKEKRLLIKYCEEKKISMTQLMRTTLVDFLEKKGFTNDRRKN